jgi:hypothetical protein
MQPTFFSIVKENAFHRPHNSWLTEEVVHHIALGIVAGSRAILKLCLRLMLRHVAAVPLSGPEVRFGETFCGFHAFALRSPRTLFGVRNGHVGLAGFHHKSLWTGQKLPCRTAASGDNTAKVTSPAISVQRQSNSRGWLHHQENRPSVNDRGNSYR